MSKVFETPTSDLSNVPLYTMRWDNPVIREVYGYQVEMPNMPPMEDMVNYGLDVNEQVFRRTFIPEDLQLWPQEEQEAFIQREYHRRYHGMWFIIKGEPIYIPGTMYFFMNYWTLETGKKALYRYSDLKFFWIWMHVVRSEKIYGLAVFKCRRMGDTEKALCMIYEYASRVRNTLNAMQDARTEDDIIKAYKRLVTSHSNMVWFMKPSNRGSNMPQKGLELTYPERKSTTGSHVSQQGELKIDGDAVFEYKPLNSEVIYYPSKPESGDGKRHGRYYCDEFGKKKMLDAIQAWGFVKKSLKDEIYNKMAGKALFTSTIEEMKDGDSLRISKKLWNNSDPDNLNDRGETITGLIRIVRGALERGTPDRWGYCDEEAIFNEIKKEQEFLVQQKKWTDLIQHKRQNCIDIKDIFSNISEGSAFNIENLTLRQHKLEYEIKPAPYIRGNFEWVGGITPLIGNPQNINKKCRVEFIPSDNGRFYVSAYPDKWNLQANAMDQYSIKPKPRNIHAFAMGIDPVSQKDVLDEDEMSLSAFTIKRVLDPMYDSNKFDEKGNPNNFGDDFLTNRYVCIYLYRHQNPEENYMDWLKAMVFYGTDFLIEKNKGDAFLLWMESYGFDNYYMETNTNVKNYQGKTEKHGLSASEKTINTYFNLLRIISDKWYNTIDFPLLCEDMASTTMGNQTKHDLTVSAGYCELAAQNKTFVSAPQEDQYTEDDYFEQRIV